jgi:prepilin-type N-terminal cleavage/methylation domain-containing protein
LFSQNPGAGKKMNHRHLKNSAGFTLIEILIAMTISGMVMTGIYQAYVQQMRVNNTQNQVVDMQQSVRVAMYFMEREIRLAGLDPSGLADSGIDVASANAITISMDITGGEADGIDNDGDGNVDDAEEWYDRIPEQTTYALSNDANPQDGMNDALFGVNNNPCHLLRNGQRLASNIDALNFVYLGVDDTDPTCVENCLLVNPTSPQERRNIRAVQITIVARAGETIPGLSMPYTDVNTYYNQPVAGNIILPAQNDGFRRIRLISEVRSRNIGLL